MIEVIVGVGFATVTIALVIVDRKLKGLHEKSRADAETFREHARGLRSLEWSLGDAFKAPHDRSIYTRDVGQRLDLLEERNRDNVAHVKKLAAALGYEYKATTEVFTGYVKKGDA